VSIKPHENNRRTIQDVLLALERIWLSIEPQGEVGKVWYGGAVNGVLSIP
jgi:hypothetical protein